MCLVLSLWIIAGNVWTILRYFLYGKTGSQGPLIGGLFGVAALLISPLGLTKLWWVPLLVDPGCALLFGSTAIWLLVWKIRGGKEKDERDTH